MREIKSMAKARNPDDYKYFPTLIFIVVFVLIVLIGLAFLLTYFVENRPLPHFSAITPRKEVFELTSYDEPSLLSSTIIKWASKAAIDVYTYKFYENDNEIANKIRPYFTDSGLSSFYYSLQPVIETLRQNQLNTNSTVNGPPVIVNQGAFGGYDQAWRVQIPFLVTYEAAGGTSTRSYRVTLVIVKVPTTQNPVGIGIDQFSM
ncbi:MAG TPA: DotI/IcmL/TraM family protein [Gammaproteobacteria bacterium]|jgi:hypothetical protein|nr:DotI/IcmL/TraM family protein [Gammaproteobacteria bacterium]